MAKRKRSKKPKTAQATDSKQLKRHMRAIGVQSVDDYQSWCRNRGLGDGLRKSANQLQNERDLCKRQQAKAALTRTRRHTRSPKNTIVQLYRREIGKGRLGADYLNKIRSLFGHFEEDTRSRRALLDVLLQVEHRADLFGLEPTISRFGRRPGNTFIEAMGALARHHQDWVRPVEDWQPASHNPRKQFGSLARHLLAQYEVPNFMDAAWFREGAAEAGRRQGWFKHVGAGGNIRTADVPVHLSKMMAHHFLLAPDDLTVDNALRWGQVAGQGGSEALARAVIGTHLGTRFEQEDFWESVILFLVNNPMLDPACVGPVVDFIHNQKYVPHEIVLPGGAVDVHSRTITQVRGKYNISTSGKTNNRNQEKLGRVYRRYLERGHIMMRRWIEREGLILAC